MCFHRIVIVVEVINSFGSMNSFLVSVVLFRSCFSLPSRAGLCPYCYSTCTTIKAARQPESRFSKTEWFSKKSVVAKFQKKTGAGNFNGHHMYEYVIRIPSLLNHPALQLSAFLPSHNVIHSVSTIPFLAAEEYPRGKWESAVCCLPPPPSSKVRD